MYGRGYAKYFIHACNLLVAWRYLKIFSKFPVSFRLNLKYAFNFKILLLLPTKY